MGRRKALFTEPDLHRALKVLEQTGQAGAYRVVIKPDGSIAIEPVRGEQAEVVDNGVKKPAHLEVIRL
jgi:hypothetical protein